MLKIFGSTIQSAYKLKVPQDGGFRGLREASQCQQILLSASVLTEGREVRALQRLTG
ncbi:hypothetical protein [Acaryochloris sp. IP29b_bin.148]|uniref:hypothetical protein n=1 Tax=Acaryochloris sp. IP29b_bin.148 TaxID=2969218 RepID=UPI002616A29D|nr:hypothetical protein [Acaryochloris sp. IP29b_bin.148]